MNNIATQVFRFIILLAVQTLIMNNIRLFGYSSPYIYILFIIGFPLTGNRNILIFLGFLLGLFVDIYSNSGGIHAGASVLIAYLRLYLLKFSFGVSFEHNNINFTQAELKQQMLYLSSMVFIHHFVLFALENFSVDLILQTLESTLISTIFSSILIYCIIIIFSKNPNR